jgi:hypothetical protein
MASEAPAAPDRAPEALEPKAANPQLEKASRAGQKKREIKGGLPYATAPGTLKRALDGIIVAERPEKFRATLWLLC